MTIAALLPMRHTSERVPGKNYRLLLESRFTNTSWASLLQCPLIDQIAIDTDSPVIQQQVLQEFPQVRLINRPEHLTSGLTPMNEILLYDVSQVQADFYIQTHSTNPLLRPRTITRAIERFLSNRPTFDSLFTVTRLQVRLWDQLTRAVNHNPAILLRTQDLPPVYEENSCLYIFNRATLENRRSRIGERPLMHEIDREEAWDIDEEIDFQVAEFLFYEPQSDGDWPYEMEGPGFSTVHAAGACLDFNPFFRKTASNRLSRRSTNDSKSMTSCDGRRMWMASSPAMTGSPNACCKPPRNSR